jgi:hypothetical protein
VSGMGLRHVTTLAAVTLAGFGAAYSLGRSGHEPGAGTATAVRLPVAADVRTAVAAGTIPLPADVPAYAAPVVRPRIVRPRVVRPAPVAPRPAAPRTTPQPATPAPPPRTQPAPPATPKQPSPKEPEPTITTIIGGD